MSWAMKLFRRLVWTNDSVEAMSRRIMDGNQLYQNQDKNLSWQRQNTSIPETLYPKCFSHQCEVSPEPPIANLTIWVFQRQPCPVLHCTLSHQRLPSRAFWGSSCENNCPEMLSLMQVIWKQIVRSIQLHQCIKWIRVCSHDGDNELRALTRFDIFT